MPLPDKDGEPAPAGGESCGVTAAAVRSEVRDFVRSHERRRHQIPRAALVGVVAGLVAVAFRRALDVGDAFRDRLIVIGHQHPAWGFLLPILFGAFGAGAAVLLVRRLAPEAAGSGIPHLKAVLHHLRGMLWQRILGVKFIGGLLGISAGLALGRE